MKDFLLHLKKVLSTVLNEPKYVREALKRRDDGPSVSLPSYYWRFYLLWPFVKEPTTSMSPFVRNFCPLFHVTNFLFIVWCIVGVPVGLVWGCCSLVMATHSRCEALWKKRKKQRTAVERAHVVLNFSVELAEDMLEEVNRLKYTGLFVGHLMRARRKQGLSTNGLPTELVDQFAILTAEDKRIMRELVLEDAATCSPWMINEKRTVLFLLQYGVSAKAQLEDMKKTYEDEVLPKIRAKEELRAAQAAAAELSRKAWAAKREKFLTTAYTKTGKVFDMVKPVGTAVVAMLGVVTVGVVLVFLLSYLPFLLSSIASLIGTIFSSEFFGMFARAMGMILVVFLTSWILYHILMRYGSELERLYAWLDKVFPPKEETFRYELLHSIATPKETGLTKMFAWILITGVVTPIEKLLNLLGAILERVGPVLAFPFIMIKMFFSKNCPAINIKDDADT